MLLEPQRCLPGQDTFPTTPWPSVGWQAPSLTQPEDSVHLQRTPWSRWGLPWPKLLGTQTSSTRVSGLQVGLHQTLAGDRSAAPPSFVTHVPVDPCRLDPCHVGDSGGEVLPPPSGLMKTSARVGFRLLKNPSRQPEWLPSLAGSPGKASGNFHFLRCF